MTRNPLTPEQRDEVEAAAEGGPAPRAETLRALLYNLDCALLEICEWSSGSVRERLCHSGDHRYYGPSHAADERGWGYLFPED